MHHMKLYHANQGKGFKPAPAKVLPLDKCGTVQDSQAAFLAHSSIANAMQTSNRYNFRSN